LVGLGSGHRGCASGNAVRLFVSTDSLRGLPHGRDAPLSRLARQASTRLSLKGTQYSTAHDDPRDNLGMLLASVPYLGVVSGRLATLRFTLSRDGLDMVDERRRSHGRKRQSEASLCSLFRLTPAEAQIALGIAGGETLAAVAKGRGVSISTARTQLKSVFAKTGTHRQAELVVLLVGSRSPFAKRGS